MKIAEAVKLAIQHNGLIARPSDSGVITVGNKPNGLDWSLTGFHLNGKEIAPNWQPTANDLIADDWVVIGCIEIKGEKSSWALRYGQVN